jgi:hypothetical protein
MATTRDDLHRLIDELAASLPPDLLERVLTALRDRRRVEPIDLVLLQAPVDDEPLTGEDRAAIAEAEADESEGRVLSHAEVWKRLAPRPRRRKPARSRQAVHRRARPAGKRPSK